MEEFKTFTSYLADRQAKENERARMHQLEQESTFYQSRIQRDLKEFIN